MRRLDSIGTGCKPRRGASQVDGQTLLASGPRSLMDAWQTLFATQAGVGAALTGLVFVALSINLKQILALPGLAARAGEALLLLMFPVVTGLVGVLPQTSGRALGAEFLVIALVLWLLVTRILFSGRQAVRERPLGEIIIRVAGAQAATFPAIIAGCLLLAGSTSGLWLLAAAVLLCVVAGVGDAWVLLVEILR
jgi:hypothetical protein